MKNELTESIIAQTNRNFALVGEFIAELIADDDLQSDLTDDALLILVPVDDLSLARANFELALRSASRGEKTRLQFVGRERPSKRSRESNELNEFGTREIHPTFPMTLPPGADLTVVYDQARDALLVDFFKSRRVVLGIPVSAHTAVRIDSETHELVGYLVVSFLQFAVAQSPVLATALRRATFRSITESELGGLEIRNRTESAMSDLEALAVVSEISRFIA